jgi:hypothetical protein
MKKYWILSINDKCVPEKKYSQRDDAIAEAKRHYHQTGQPVILLECMGIYKATGESYQQIWEVEAPVEKIEQKDDGVPF